MPKQPITIAHEVMKQQNFDPEKDYKMIYELEDGFLEVYKDEDNKLKYELVNTDEDSRLIIDRKSLKDTSIIEFSMGFIDYNK